MIYRLMHTIVLMMSYIPLRMGQFFGKMLGTVFTMIPMERTALSLEHIKKSFGHSMSETEAKRLNRKVIRHFGQMVFEVPHIMRLNSRNLSKYVVFEHEENLHQAFERGKGVFLLTGHFGNWELMSAALAARFSDMRGAVVARPIDFEPLDKLVNGLRSRFGTEIIMKQRGMRRVLGAVKENKGVGILLDQNVDWYEGVFVKFLGRWACTNKGLALLALRTGAPVIPIFPVRQKDGHYRIFIEPEVELIRTGDKTKDVEENTARFTRAIDRQVRAHPDQYFWFHRRWKTKPYCTLPNAERVTQKHEGPKRGGTGLESSGDQEKRWSAAQSKEDAFWQRDGVLDSQMERVISRYGPVLKRIEEQLDAHSTILDVGCGPTCSAQLFSGGLKTYIDPLMDSYLETYPEKLPEGEKICSTAEDIPRPDGSFDVVLCVNALDHMIDPEKALTEMRRVMKTDGLFVLGIFLHPPPIAKVRRFIERWLPIFREDAHPYSYTLKGIREVLNTYFTIYEEIRVFRRDSSMIPSLHREDWMFVCKKT